MDQNYGFFNLIFGNEESSLIKLSNITNLIIKESILEFHNVINASVNIIQNTEKILIFTTSFLELQSTDSSHYPLPLLRITPPLCVPLLGSTIPSGNSNIFGPKTPGAFSKNKLGSANNFYQPGSEMNFSQTLEDVQYLEYVRTHGSIVPLEIANVTVIRKSTGNVQNNGGMITFQSNGTYTNTGVRSSVSAVRTESVRSDASEEELKLVFRRLGYGDTNISRTFLGFDTYTWTVQFLEESLPDSYQIR